LTNKWSAGSTTCTKGMLGDDNNDGFLDCSFGVNRINVLIGWQYQDRVKVAGKLINLRFLSDEKQVGQTNFNPATISFYQ